MASVCILNMRDKLQNMGLSQLNAATWGMSKTKRNTSLLLLTEAAGAKTMSGVDHCLWIWSKKDGGQKSKALLRGESMYCALVVRPRLRALEL